MNQRDLEIIRAQTKSIESYSTKVAVAELRHLTFGPYIEANSEGRVDHGFNCRTNAFIAAGSLAVVGCFTMVIHGKATFIIGPSADLDPIGFDVDPHAWVGIEKHGYFDISPSFRSSREPRFKAADEMLTVRGKLRPVGKTFMAQDEYDYETHIARATHAQGERTAVYLGLEFDEMSCALLSENLFDLYNSPLTDVLREKYNSNIMIKAIWHMVNFVHGRTSTLTCVAQSEAWRKIDKIGDSKIEWVSRRLNRSVRPSDSP